MSTDDTTPNPEAKSDNATSESPNLNIEDAIPQVKETVGLSKYLDEKTKRKEAEARAEALQAELDSALTRSQEASKEAVDDDISKIAEKYTDVSPELLKDLVAIAKSKVDAEYGPKLASYEAERHHELANKKFDELYTRTLKEMPEYSQVINPEVIKSLAFNPANSKKTMNQIFEEAYGNAIIGRKTLESSTGNARKSGEIDFANMGDKDWEALENDPELKKKHADYTMSHLRGMF